MALNEAALDDLIKRLRHAFAVAADVRSGYAVVAQSNISVGRAASVVGPNPLRIALSISLPTGVAGWVGTNRSIQSAINQGGPLGFSIPAGGTRDIDYQGASKAWWILTDSPATVSYEETIGDVPYP